MLANKDLRNRAKKSNVSLWEIADVMGISEPTMTRYMRRELPNQKKQEILQIIDDLAKAKEDE